MAVVVKLTKRTVDERCVTVPGRAQALYWDQALRGFGVIVGRTGTKTFVLQHRGRRIAIGRYGPWTPDAARVRAQELIVELDRGEDPRRRAARGVTLAVALEEHVARLRAKGGSERSIGDLDYSIRHYLGAWLSRPLAELTKAEVRTRHRRITEENGAYAANRTMRWLRALHNSAAKTYDLPPNPTIAIEWNRERPARDPIPWEELPSWRATVERLSPVLRDLQLVYLFLGLRSEDGASIRWEDVDFDAATLHRPCPKGGEDRAFTVPVPVVLLEVLRRRREENIVLFDDDQGWVFPTRDRTGAIVPIVERRWNQRAARCNPHRLRHTYTTACQEAGLGPYDIDVLTNHRPPRGTITAIYIQQSLEHLRDCQEKVAVFLIKQTERA